jgi:riboflavin kinase/FMN adenylyltransferase
MDIIRGLQNRLDYPNPVVTIGNFDGVHLGHQKIFRSVVERAKKIKGTPIAITFSPHPVRVLAPEKGLKIITGFEDKAKLISGAGIKVLIGINFDREFARMEPDDFIKNILVDMIGTKWVIVGHNYTFGKAKKGRADLLRRRGRRYGFGVSVVRYAKVYGDIVSSSRVRSLILRGRVCETSRMLGRLYHIEGTVIKGAGRGASLMNIPTANIAATNELIPKEGVYAVRVSFDDNVHNGVANIGSNPTFDGNKMSYEVHIFDFNRNILGKKVRIHFIDRIRDEKKFLGFKELEEQIKKDIEKAEFIISKRDDPLYL